MMVRSVCQQSFLTVWTLPIEPHSRRSFPGWWESDTTAGWMLRFHYHSLLHSSLPYHTAGGSGISPTVSPSTSRPTSSNCSLRFHTRQTCNAVCYFVGAWRIPLPWWEGRIPADWQFLLATSSDGRSFTVFHQSSPPSAHFYFPSPSPALIAPAPPFPSQITATSLPIHHPFFSSPLLKSFGSNGT